MRLLANRGVNWRNPSSKSVQVLRACLFACLVLVTPAVAQAEQPSPAEVTEQTAAAVASEGSDPAVANQRAEIPTTGSDAATLHLADGGDIAIGLPATGTGRSNGGLTTIYDGAVPASAVAVEPTREGLRALITVESSMAPERYAFPISGDAVRLVETGDGSVIAYDSAMTAIAMLAPAWARDAAGRVVPSHYELVGTTVIQVVEHRDGGFAYGVTADPWWNPLSWDWEKIGKAAVSGLTKCGGGALKGALGIGGGVVTVNLIKKGAGTFMVRAAGGPYVYVAGATAGCIQDML